MSGFSVGLGGYGLDRGDYGWSRRGFGGWAGSAAVGAGWSRRFFAFVGFLVPGHGEEDVFEHRAGTVWVGLGFGFGHLGDGREWAELRVEGYLLDRVLGDAAEC